MSINTNLILTILFVAICAINAKNQLPTFLKPCSLSDPNMEKCMLDSAVLVVEHIKNGDKKYKIPSMLPLKITEINLTPGDNLSIKLKNIVITGVETSKVYSIKHDVGKKELDFKFLIPKVSLACDYEIKGKILVLPIEGNGYLEINAEDADCNVIGRYDTIEKDGEKYVKFVQDKSILNIDFKSMKFRLDNLFNGDKTLGNEMNKFLNENWKEASKEFVPAFNQVMSIIIFDLLNHASDGVPYDDIFLP